MNHPCSRINERIIKFTPSWMRPNSIRAGCTLSYLKGSKGQSFYHMVSSLSFFNLQSDFVLNFIVLKFIYLSNMLLVIWGVVHVPLAAVFLFSFLRSSQCGHL
jgi:hypothetical protein